MTNDNKRGGTVAENGNGKLERVSPSTCVGTATLESGKVLTKRFRGSVPEEADIVARWEKWQGRKMVPADDGYEEEDMAEAGGARCPMSGAECTAACPMFSVENQACAVMLGGIALYNMSTNLMKLDAGEPIEMVAMAVGELGSAIAAARPVSETADTRQAPMKEPTEAEGLDAFLKGKTFLNFVNLHGKAVNGQYTKFCKDNGYPAMRESELIAVVAARYPELKRVTKMGGSMFVAA